MANQEVFFDETNLSSFTGKPGEEIILPLNTRHQMVLLQQDLV